ncbi:MAG: acyl carrier protein [Ignavibacterium sp.]
MTQEKILNDLQDIFRDVFNNYNLMITEDTKNNDITDWDSLQHIVLIMSLEKQFNIKFTSEETTKLLDVKTIIDAIEKKIN